MKQVIPGMGPRCLALTLIGSLVAGCGSKQEAVKVDGVSEGPPPKTERARKAAEFERELKTKTKRD